MKLLAKVQWDTFHKDSFDRLRKTSLQCSVGPLSESLRLRKESAGKEAHLLPPPGQKTSFAFPLLKEELCVLHIAGSPVLTYEHQDLPPAGRGHKVWLALPDNLLTAAFKVQGFH